MFANTVLLPLPWTRPADGPALAAGTPMPSRGRCWDVRTSRSPMSCAARPAAGDSAAVRLPVRPGEHRLRGAAAARLRRSVRCGRAGTGGQVPHHALGGRARGRTRLPVGVRRRPVHRRDAAGHGPPLPPDPRPRWPAAPHHRCANWSPVPRAPCPSTAEAPPGTRTSPPSPTASPGRPPAPRRPGRQRRRRRHPQLRRTRRTVAAPRRGTGRALPASRPTPAPAGRGPVPGPLRRARRGAPGRGPAQPHRRTARPLLPADPAAPRPRPGRPAVRPGHAGRAPALDTLLPDVRCATRRPGGPDTAERGRVRRRQADPGRAPVDCPHTTARAPCTPCSPPAPPASPRACRSPTAPCAT